MYPKRKTCERCGNPFDAVIPSQTECLACMVRPSHREPDETEQKKGEGKGMARNFKNKICGCGKPFTSTSPSQKRCPDCMAAGKQYSEPKTKRQTADPPGPAGALALKADMAISEMIRAVMDKTGATSVTFTIARQETP